MKIPKEIVEKMEKVNTLIYEIDEWLRENIDVDGSMYEHSQEYYRFIEKPKGDEQDSGAYVDQDAVGWDGDSWEGKCYYPTDKGDYFYFDFYI